MEQGCAGIWFLGHCFGREPKPRPDGQMLCDYCYKETVQEEQDWASIKTGDILEHHTPDDGPGTSVFISYVKVLKKNKLSLRCLRCEADGVCHSAIQEIVYRSSKNKRRSFNWRHKFYAAREAAEQN